MEKKLLRVYVADLGAYNEGNIRGVWVDLPADIEELDKVIAQCTRDGEGDYAIHDYELSPLINNLEIQEDFDLRKLNETALWLEELDGDELLILNQLLDETGKGLQDYALEQGLTYICNKEYTLHTDIQSYRDLGYYYITDISGIDLDNMSYIITDNLNLESVGKDYLLSRNCSVTSFFVPDLGYVEFSGCI